LSVPFEVEFSAKIQTFHNQRQASGESGSVGNKPLVTRKDAEETENQGLMSRERMRKTTNAPTKWPKAGGQGGRFSRDSLEGNATGAPRLMISIITINYSYMVADGGASKG